MAELAVPLLQDPEPSDEQQAGQQEISGRQRSAPDREPLQQQQRSAGAAGDAASGDLEEGLLAGSSRAASEANASSKSDEVAVLAVARASRLLGPGIYFGDLLRLAIFYWAIVSDALLMKELYSRQYLLLAGLSTGFTVGPHVIMSLLLIVRQGWLAAASQACGFILTLNPFESLTPIPQGILGLFVLSLGFIAYVLIAASGLIFVAYCVICYLVTALLFSLLILDLAALVITVAPSKAIFKYTDLVYTENFKFSRLILQAWLQSAPELGLLGWVLYRNLSPGGPAVVIPGPILLQALAAHALTFVDKCLLFRSAVAVSGCSTGRQLLLLLGIKGSPRLSLPVLKENMARVLRGAGGGSDAAAGGLGAVLHLSCYEDVPDTDSDAAASMVPEYLTPQNGGMLSPGQAMGLSAAVFARYGGPEVAELVLELTQEVMAGKMLSHVAASVPNVSSVRIVNGAVCGADAAALASAMLQWSGLRTLQLHQAVIDEAGARALARLLEGTPTLQQLELCRCRLRRRAAAALARGVRVNRTLRQLNMAGVRGLDEAGACAIAGAVAGSKVLGALNLAFVKLSEAAVDALVQAVNGSSSLRVLAVSQADVPTAATARLVAAVTALAGPKAPPSLSCGLTLGTFSAQGLDDKVQFLVVQDQDALLLDAWQGLASGDGAHEQPDTAAAAAAALQLRAHQHQLLQEQDGSSTQHDEAAPLLASMPPGSTVQQHGEIGWTGSGGSSGSSGSAPHAAAATFGVVSSPGGPSAAAAASSLLPKASAAWFNGASASGSSSSSHLESVASFTQPQDAPAARLPAAAGSASASGGAGSSKAAAAACCSPGLACPCLVLVVLQDECVSCMTQSPLLFRELDTLDLTGLGIGDEGAASMAATLEANPVLRRAVLADNKVGEAGGAALARALAVNTALQVLDLSANEFSEEGVAVLADATLHAAGLRQLRLLGNKIPFGLETLRRLMQAEAANPQCRLVLVEEPAEALDALEQAGDAAQLARATDFYARHEAYRHQRRQRPAARQQQRAARRANRQQQQEGEAAAGTAAAAPVPGDSAGAAAEGGTSSSPSPPSQPPQLQEQAQEQEQPQPQLHVATHPPPTARSTAGGSGSPPGGSSSPAGASTPVCCSGSASSATGGDEDTCGICFDNSNHVAVKYCGHLLCVDCYRKVWELSGADATCPFCRARLEGYTYLDSPPWFAL